MNSLGSQRQHYFGTLRTLAFRGYSVAQRHQLKNAGQCAAIRRPHYDKSQRPRKLYENGAEFRLNINLQRS